MNKEHVSFLMSELVSDGKLISHKIEDMYLIEKDEFIKRGLSVCLNINEDLKNVGLVILNVICLMDIGISEVEKADMLLTLQDFLIDYGKLIDYEYLLYESVLKVESNEYVVEDVSFIVENLVDTKNKVVSFSRVISQ